jgi:hypothetical protein
MWFGVRTWIFSHVADFMRTHRPEDGNSLRFVCVEQENFRIQIALSLIPRPTKPKSIRQLSYQIKSLVNADPKHQHLRREIESRFIGIVILAEVVVSILRDKIVIVARKQTVLPLLLFVNRDQSQPFPLLIHQRINLSTDSPFFRPNFASSDGKLKSKKEQ